MNIRPYLSNRDILNKASFCSPDKNNMKAQTD